MIKRHLYVQVCLLIAGALLSFAVLAALLWNIVGHERHERALFDKTTALAALLLPPADAPKAEQLQAIQKIAETLEFEITLWSKDKKLIAASDTAREPSVDTLAHDRWVGSEGDTHWTAVLADGRWVVVYLDRIAVPSESTGVAMMLIVLAVFIAIIMFPFARHQTRRLEQLQREVVRIGQGDLTARVNIGGDDEISLLARSFNDSATRIESLVAAQRMLLANASHELRTPLARIRLGIEMLQKADDPARRKALQGDIEELDALIDELILMARLDSGRSGVAFQQVDLVALVAEECARYRGCSFTGTAAEVSGDYRMLQHLVRNLIDNAHAHGKPPVEVAVVRQSDEVRLVVSDAGPGIPEADREKVFQPFYRGADRQNVKGYGLGLPLVQRIAALHGARVVIDNQPVSSIRIVFDASSPNTLISATSEARDQSSSTVHLRKTGLSASSPKAGLP